MVTLSGFDGPWTTHPLRFDNEYFTNLLYRNWTVKKWTGPKQFEDEVTPSICCSASSLTRECLRAQTGKLMMLPSDIALIEDAKFKKWVEVYAKDQVSRSLLDGLFHANRVSFGQNKFFEDFAKAFAKLMSVGCPPECDPFKETGETKACPRHAASAEFREQAMHGSVGAAKKLMQAGLADPHQLEATSGRSAVHKVCAQCAHCALLRLLTVICSLRPLSGVTVRSIVG